MERFAGNHRRRRLRAACGAAALALAALTPVQATAATTPEPGAVVTHDLMPDFWGFWQAAQHAAPAERLALWDRLYVQQNAAVFADLSAPCSRHFAAGALERDYFPLLEQLVPQMRPLARSLPEMIATARRRFSAVFPDMHWSADIYLMASGGCFNGRAQAIQGREALLLGLDNIVGLRETNLPPLLEHELFHRYQHAFFAFEPERAQPLWVRLWAEGMATLVAHRLSPAASDWDLMWIDAGRIGQLDAGKARIAADFLRRFDSASQADADLYFSDDSENATIPARAGYYLGLQVAEQLASDYPLQALAHWNRSEARPYIRAALERLRRGD